MSFPGTLRALLNGKRTSWADLETGTYLGPHGLDAHRVEVNGVELIIPGVAGSVTFRPGDAVLIGAPAGGVRRVVIGRPPAGKGGQSAFFPEQLEVTVSALALEAVDPDELAESSSAAPVVLLGRDLAGATLAEAVDFDLATEEVVVDDRVSIDLGTMTDPVPPDLPAGQVARDAEVTLDPAVAAGEVLTVRVRNSERRSTLPEAIRIIASAFYARVLSETASELILWGVTAAGGLVEIARQSASYDGVQALTGDAFVVGVDGTIDPAGPIIGTELHTLDLVNGTAASHLPAAGKFIAAPAVAADGRVWWTEWDTVPGVNQIGVRVYSAGIDLVAPVLEHDTIHLWSPSASWPGYMNAWHLGGLFAAASGAFTVPTLSHWDLVDPGNDTTFPVASFETGQGSPRPHGLESLRTVFRTGDSTWRAKHWPGSGSPVTDSAETSWPTTAGPGSELIARDLYPDGARVLRLWDDGGGVWKVGEVDTFGNPSAEPDKTIDLTDLEGTLIAITTP